MIVCETEDFVVDKEWLTREFVTTPPLGQPFSRELLTQEKELIETVLAETKGRVSRAAATLGIPRSTLESKIRSLKIDMQRFKTV